MRYPSWTDFHIDKVCYGLGAPFVGIGIYTLDKKFSWPDREGTKKDEYNNWAEHLKSSGYEVPEEYINAYFTPAAK
jgi:hypothetical protein